MCSHVGRSVAISSGLRGHPRLIGHSLNNDRIIFDYLARCNVCIQGVEIPLIVKVGNIDQPVRLGLDLMVATSMVLDLRTRTAHVATTPTFNESTTGFRFIDYAELMRRQGLREADLPPFTALTDAQAAASAGAHMGINLGYSTASGGVQCIDLGTSY